jgi:hypothetical protein
MSMVRRFAARLDDEARGGSVTEGDQLEHIAELVVGHRRELTELAFDRSA